MIHHPARLALLALLLGSQGLKVETLFAQIPSVDTPRITLSSPRLKDSAFEFTASSSVPLMGVIEFSTNWVQWTPVRTNSLSTNSTVHELALPALAGWQMFRVRPLSAEGSREDVVVVVGPSGGTLVLSDQAKVILPPGLLDSAQEVRFSKLISNPVEAWNPDGEPVSTYSLELSDDFPDSTLQIILPIDPESPGDDGDDVLVLARHGDDTEWAPLVNPVEDGDNEDEKKAQPFEIDRTGGSLTIWYSTQDRAGSRGVLQGADGPKKKKKVLLDLVSGLRSRFVDNANGKVLVVEGYWVGGTKQKKRVPLFSFPFKLQANSELPNLFFFDVTRDHSSEPGFLWYGTNGNIRSANGTPVRTKKVSHVVLHDYGTGGTKESPTLLPTIGVLREVCIKRTTAFAHYNIDLSGNIFQLAPTNKEAPHAIGNSPVSVGIEMERKALWGGFENATLQAAARLTAFLLKGLDLKFDPCLEKKTHTTGPDAKERFFNHGVQVTKNTKIGKQVVTNIVVLLPGAAPNVSLVAHNEIQGNRLDPEGLDWDDFINRVANFLPSPCAPTLVIEGPQDSNGGYIARLTPRGIVALPAGEAPSYRLKIHGGTWGAGQTFGQVDPGDPSVLFTEPFTSAQLTGVTFTCYTVPGATTNTAAVEVTSLDLGRSYVTQPLPSVFVFDDYAKAGDFWVYVDDKYRDPVWSQNSSKGLIIPDLGAWSKTPCIPHDIRFGLSGLRGDLPFAVACVWLPPWFEVKRVRTTYRSGRVEDATSFVPGECVSFQGRGSESLLVLNIEFKISRR